MYEAVLEGIILFLILLYFQKKEYLKVPGLISGLFLTFYSLFRFLTEFFRAPDEQLGYLLLNLTMGQIISIIFFLIGTYLIIKKMKTEKKFNIPLDKFIEFSLYNKKFGYYMKKIRLEKKGFHNLT